MKINKNVYTHIKFHVFKLEFDNANFEYFIYNINHINSTYKFTWNYFINKFIGYTTKNTT